MLKIKSVISLALVIIISLTFFACSKSGNGEASVFNYSKNDSSAVSDNLSLYSSDESRENLLRISRSDMTTLYFDESNFSISVYDVGSDFLWSSLPKKYIDEKPAVLTLKVLVDGKEYDLNCTDDSVAKGNATYETSDDSLKINYGFSLTSDSGKNISFNIPVSFTVADGMLTVSSDLSNLSKNLGDGVYVQSISLLPYFGSNNSGKTGDFIFVPDGCGALISTKSNPAKFSPISIPVYGADYGSMEADASLSANIGTFGMKRGSSAFIALIESGDSLAKINATKALKKSSYNKVGSEFDITKVYRDEEADKIFVSDNTYDGSLQITYRFLSGQNATYPAMASVCRELLMRNGMLKSTTQSEKSELPLNLSIIGAADVTSNNKTNHRVLTNYSEAEDILSSLKAKGFNNINLRYEGIFDGGISQELMSKAEISSKVGSKKDLASLISYTDTQNISLFANADILSFSKGGKSAVDIGCKAISLDTNSINSKVISAFERQLLCVGEIADNTNSMLAYLRKTDIDGVCIDDAGSILYSDSCKGNSFTRQQAEEIISSQCNAVSSSKLLMVNSGNIYTLKYASAIWDLPDSSVLSKNDYCKAVPFLQIILHGFTDYSCTPINISKSFENAILRCIEYGSVPSFRWYYDNLAADGETDKYCYINSISEAQQYYDRMNAAFSGLSSAKITNHYQVDVGVFCTEYDNNSAIYVNYNKKAVNVNGVSIEGKSFIRIN